MGGVKLLSCGRNIFFILVVFCASIQLFSLRPLWADGEALGSRMESGWAPCEDNLYTGVDSQGWQIYKETVEKTEKYQEDPRIKDESVQLFWATDRGFFGFQLGPVWFLDRQADSLRKGDAVVVHGYYSSWDGRSVIVAALVEREDGELRLLDRDGTPVWCAWRYHGEAGK